MLKKSAEGKCPELLRDYNLLLKTAARIVRGPASTKAKDTQTPVSWSSQLTLQRVAMIEELQGIEQFRYLKDQFWMGWAAEVLLCSACKHAVANDSRGGGSGGRGNHTRGTERKAGRSSRGGTREKAEPKVEVEPEMEKEREPEAEDDDETDEAPVAR